MRAGRIPGVMHQPCKERQASEADRQSKAHPDAVPKLSFKGAVLQGEAVRGGVLLEGKHTRDGDHFAAFFPAAFASFFLRFSSRSENIVPRQFFAPQ